MRLLLLTLEPDGQATGCNPVQVGSTPTGVSDFALVRIVVRPCAQYRARRECSSFLSRRPGVGWRPKDGLERDRPTSIRHHRRTPGDPKRAVASLTVENYVKTIALIAARDPSGTPSRPASWHRH